MEKIYELYCFLLKMACIPSGAELFYIIFITTLSSFVIVINKRIKFYTNKWKLFLSFIIMFTGIICWYVISELLIVEYVNDKVSYNGVVKNLIIPLPMPGLRESGFYQYAPGGTFFPRLDGFQLHNRVFNKDNYIGTCITILLHLSSLSFAIVGMIKIMIPFVYRFFECKNLKEYINR